MKKEARRKSPSRPLTQREIEHVVGGALNVYAAVELSSAGALSGDATAEVEGSNVSADHVEVY